MYRAKSILTSLAFASLAAFASAENQDSSSLTIALTKENFAQHTNENDFLILFFAPE